MYKLYSWIVIVTIGVAGVAVHGQSAAFTYQGQLKMQGVPLNEAVDLRFTLLDSESAGSPVAGPIMFDGSLLPAVQVTNGLFSVELDFGPGALLLGHWLEIEVRSPHDPTDQGAYTALSPRQKITAAPFALSVPGLATDPTGVQVAGDVQAAGEVTASAYSSNSPFIIKVNPADVECARFDDATCYFGLGTTAPQALLHMGGVAGVDGIMFPDGTLQTTAAGSVVGGDSVWSLSGGGDIFYTQGNVGIGTAAPASKLDIAAVGDGAELLRFTTERPWVFRQIRTGPVTGLELRSTVGQKIFEVTANDGANVAAFVADSANSKVGIGTFSPATKLHILHPPDSVSLRIETGGGINAWSKAEFVNANGQWHIGSSRGFNNDVFYVDRIGTLALDYQFATSGALGLGIEPQAKLHMFDPVNSVSHRIQTGGGTNAWSRIEFVNGDGEWLVGTSRNYNGNELSFYRLGAARPAMSILPAGGVSIGAVRIPPGVQLAVGGKVLCEEMEVQLQGNWPDFVFDDNYPLMPLAELEKSVTEKGHLPGIPSAETVARDGINVGDMQAKLLQKVEELTLYVIQVNEDVEAVRAENELLRARIVELEAAR